MVRDRLFDVSLSGIDGDEVVEARGRLRGLLDGLRGVAGFPVGDDDAVVGMSVPPFYTACPNPFLGEWLERVTEGRGEVDVDRVDPGPFAGDISVGKGNLFYKAHSYPTKVPHPAIMRFLMHYTRPGDVVLDGFAGTGMLGVAAQACANPDAKVKAEIEAELGEVEWGARHAVLQDLSPLASFIAAGLNLPVDGAAFEERAKGILEEFDEEWGWMFETTHSDGRKVLIDYTVWSEVFTCPSCGGEVVFYDVAFNSRTGRVAESFDCGSCGAELTKRSAEQRKVPMRTLAGDTTERIELRPVRIHYRVGKTKLDKAPDDQDRDVLRRIARLDLPEWVPTAELPTETMVHGSRLAPKGFTHIHHFWSDRSLVTLAVLWAQANREADPGLGLALKFWVEQAFWGLSWMNRLKGNDYSQVNRYQTGVYYVSSLVAECSPRYNLEGTSPARGKLRNLAKMWSGSPARAGRVAISTGSSTDIALPDASVDYVFVDPPFGANIPYGDLGLVVESWHAALEAVGQEATVDEFKGRALPEYQVLMEGCFGEFFRVLKPGRWMTVEFSNSKSEVWLAIQEALSAAGFVVADTRVFDKEQGSYRQVTAVNAVKRDLIISAYKPAAEAEERIRLAEGEEDSAWVFVREHLAHLPVGDGRRGVAQVVRERHGDRLYDRMVAYHVHSNLAVPLTAAEFYAGMDRRFPERDGMFFLPEQAEAYERLRMAVKDLVAAELFITGESSAVQWLRQFLKSKSRPQAYDEIQPPYFQELQEGLPDWEVLPELLVLLEQNFVTDDEGRWYVPDPKKASDLEKVRRGGLLKEFVTYTEGRGKLARFRSEAIRAGFDDAWDRDDYETIVAVGDRLPLDVFGDEPTLLYYFDNAKQLIGE
jgi:predicted RNA methylase/predicted RNA-binding Zn-ribbon protein involved in translation (DUF1610 family)